MTEPTRTSSTRVPDGAARSIDAITEPPLEIAQYEPTASGPGGVLHVERSPVIRSKIQPPPLRSSTLSRQRLLDKLRDATASRLTLITAEAGYGKTTLLADFSARASARCLWYRLDPTDADPITWTNYLIAAAREIDPSFGRATESLLAQIGPGGPPETAFAASLLGELPSLGEAPTILVLDDFQEVEASDEAREYVSRLLKDAPPWLRFVISARRRPSLELARLAGRGEVAELTTDELRFAPAETRDLFSQGYGIDLDPDVLETIGDKTKGWAASLQLFQGSVHGRPASAVRAFAMSLSGADSPMYDFLAQEVLNNVDGDLEEFLLRSSLLDRVTLSSAVALFPERRGLSPETREVAAWIAECDQRGLITRLSATSDARQLHPLLRDFLLRALSHRHSTDTIRQIHVSLAKSFEEADPLAASRHFIEAGLDSDAMACLERSTMLAIGSGRWGDASRLADRLSGVPAGPAVAALKARRLIEEGAFEAAASLLNSADISSAPAEIRATIRNAQLALAWRTSDRDLLYEALRALTADPETPSHIGDVAAVFTDASPLSVRRASLPALGLKLAEMSSSQAAAGLQFFSAVSLHNASIAFRNAGELRTAIRMADAALTAFESLPFSAAERFSTHSVLAGVYLELGNRALADENCIRAVAHGEEFADVSADMAFYSLVTGDRKGGLAALARTESLLRLGRTDGTGNVIADTTAAFASLPSSPDLAIERLERDVTFPIDFGETLFRRTVLALAYLLAGRTGDSFDMAISALDESRSRLARLAEARLQILVALARNDPVELTTAVGNAALVGQLAVLELADGIANHLDVFSPVPAEIEASIVAWPGRWLPALRRQLEQGDSPTGRAAARLLDAHGELQDIGRLRAYARTYRSRGRLAPLGVSLAHRVSPRLMVHDLGRVLLSVGGRSVELASIRRKPAALLMYLITRPEFTANREQVLDELWPDNYPSSASNSLNQSLYFLRREFDPWYEDDLSVDYVSVQGDLVWLDRRLVKAESVDFLHAAQAAIRDRVPADAAVNLLNGYRGPFAPEFEYEDWAITWRTKAHTAFLELASRALVDAIDTDDLAAGRDIAVHALDMDMDNTELEAKLVWLYWHMGARAAAAAQYQHLAAREKADGVDPLPLETIVSTAKPS